MKETTKKKLANWTRGILSVLLFAYIVFAFIFTDRLYASETLNNVVVNINSSEKSRFVTEESIISEISIPLTDPRNNTPFPIHNIERALKDVVNIEDANVTRSSLGNIHIDVTPMIPVARVFDPDGYSYYINRDGKKLQADITYHIDVPIITGHVDDGRLAAQELLPLMKFISSDSLWNSLTSAIKVDSHHDVILIPQIKGHVVNLGNCHDRNLANKFDRLKTFYRKVMPMVGWNYYDTVSVKYNGQIVATKAQKRLPTPELQFELIDSEEVDLDNLDTTPST